MTLRFRSALALALMLASAHALAQGAAPATPATPAPAPAAPASPAPVAPAAPAAPATPAPAVPTPAPASPAPAAPKAEDSTAAGTQIEVAAKPVLRIKGKSTWDDGFDNLRKALDALDAEAKKLALAADGNPMTYFVDSDDNGFTYEAMLPLKEAPAAATAFSKDIDATLSPAGRAVVFTHEGAYDDIDSAYEALTAWLDDKNLVSSGKFLEEYVHWPGKSDETAMKLRIIVFLK